jgi:hypothetical protein
VDFREDIGVEIAICIGAASSIEYEGLIDEILDKLEVSELVAIDSVKGVKGVKGC